MITLIADAHIPFMEGILESHAKVIYIPGGRIDHELASDADGLIIRTRTHCNAELLKSTRVKFIATATIGFDHIDTDFCALNNIAWNHAPGCNSSSVKQYVAAALVTLARKHHFSLKGKRIGIIGVGHVGEKIAQLAGTLGMIPLLNDPPRERLEGSRQFVSLEEIQETADIITFHVPLSHQGADKTYHIADERFFKNLGNKPFVLNTSRGPVTKTQAVKEGILSGVISGYVADVWENEPSIDKGLLDLSDIATPHIAGYSVEGKANGTASCVRAVSRFFNLGMDDWYPSHLPPPQRPVIELNADNISEERIIGNAILSTYNVLDDDKAFRANPSRFEDLRNFYPIRREFTAFTLKFNGNKPAFLDSLMSIGFNIE